MTVNFETLSKEANQEGASEEAKNSLWKAVFDLEYWYCIALFEGEKSYPFNVNHKGKASILCFTDHHQAVSFAERQGLYPQETSKPLMSIKSNEAADYFAKFGPLGLDGVCFNHGIEDFYTSFQELLDIQKETLS